MAMTTVVHGPWKTGRPSIRTFAPKHRTHGPSASGGRPTTTMFTAPASAAGRVVVEAQEVEIELDTRVGPARPGAGVRGRPRPRGREVASGRKRTRTPGRPATAAARSASLPASSRSAGAEAGRPHSSPGLITRREL